MFFFCWTNNLWIPRQSSTRLNQWVETIRLLHPYKFCQIRDLTEDLTVLLPKRNSCSVGFSFLDSRGWRVLQLWQKPQLGPQCCCIRKNPTKRHTSLEKQVSVFLELKKSLVSMLITLKCRSSHRSKGRLFACFSTKPLWTSWLWLHLSDQKDKKSANAKQKPNEKIALLLVHRISKWRLCISVK